MPASSTPDYAHSIKRTLLKAGYTNASKIAVSLQGSIWRCLDDTNQSVVIKVTNKNLHKTKSVIHHGEKIVVKHTENIAKETKILKLLSQQPNAPNSIVKFINFFKSNINYFLVMEDGGSSLFQFVLRAHKCIESGNLEISEWHKISKVIFSQITQCIEYIHSQNICHMDISLENFLISDVDVIQNANTGKIQFILDTVQVKLCDFGLAEMFKDNRCVSNKYCGKTNYKSPEIISKVHFNAKSNDIWCMGICLFMMIIGSSPFTTASIRDESFKMIINGGMNALLFHWGRLHMITPEISHLFSILFKYENKRCKLRHIKKSAWLN